MFSSVFDEKRIKSHVMYFTITYMYCETNVADQPDACFHVNRSFYITLTNTTVSKRIETFA